MGADHEASDRSRKMLPSDTVAIAQRTFPDVSRPLALQQPVAEEIRESAQRGTTSGNLYHGLKSSPIQFLIVAIKCAVSHMGVRLDTMSCD